MRTVLALVAFITLAYMGLSRVMRLARRIDILRALAGDIGVIDEDMRYKRLPLKSLLASNEQLSLTGFWHAARDALNSGENAKAAFDIAMRHSDIKPLTAYERAALSDYLGMLGHTRLENQHENAKNAITRLNRIASALEAEKQRCGGLYGQLGIFGGLAAALILI